jgi:hypothetical protein
MSHGTAPAYSLHSAMVQGALSKIHEGSFKDENHRIAAIVVAAFGHGAWRLGAGW